MATVPPTSSLDDLRAELADLQERVRQTRRERLDLTSATPNQRLLVDAAARARQDRDAQISPQLTEVRKTLGEKVSQLNEWWESADGHRWILRRIEETRFTDVLKLTPHRREALDAALRDEAYERENARERLAPFGITVPALFGQPDGGR